MTMEEEPSGASGKVDSTQAHDSGRRRFLQGVALSSGVFASAGTGAAENTTALAAAPETGLAAGPAGLALTAAVALTINGVQHELALDPRVTLLDALRERLDLTGSKKGCDHGQCGACTVLLDGWATLACLTLAVSAQDVAITTIEGLAKANELHPMQAAFIEHDGFQCGYCTPGQICSAVALVNERRVNSDSEIREWMSGNLCRCGAYPNIVTAIRQVLDAPVIPA